MQRSGRREDFKEAQTGSRVHAHGWVSTNKHPEYSERAAAMDPAQILDVCGPVAAGPASKLVHEKLCQNRHIAREIVLREGLCQNSLVQSRSLSQSKAGEVLCHGPRKSACDANMSCTDRLAHSTLDFFTRTELGVVIEPMLNASGRADSVQGVWPPPPTWD